MHGYISKSIKFKAEGDILPSKHILLLP